MPQYPSSGENIIWPFAKTPFPWTVVVQSQRLCRVQVLSVATWFLGKFCTNELRGRVWGSMASLRGGLWVEISRLSLPLPLCSCRERAGVANDCGCQTLIFYLLISSKGGRGNYCAGVAARLGGNGRKRRVMRCVFFFPRLEPQITCELCTCERKIINNTKDLKCKYSGSSTRPIIYTEVQRNWRGSRLGRRGSYKKKNSKLKLWVNSYRNTQGCLNLV